MSEHIPWRCRILRFLRLHGRVWLSDNPTPSGHCPCKGCGRLYL